MGYIVPFLTISSILIDVCFSNLIFIGAIFNSYNYWYLLSYSNQFTLHYSILFLIISIIIILFFYYYIKFIINSSYLGFSFILSNYYSAIRFLAFYLIVISLKIISYPFGLINLISYSFFSNFTFFIPIYLDFFLIFSIFFFKGPINSIEVFTGFNLCYSILFYNFFSLFFQIQFIILVIVDDALIDIKVIDELMHKGSY